MQDPHLLSLGDLERVPGHPFWLLKRNTAIPNIRQNLLTKRQGQKDPESARHEPFGSVARAGRCNEDAHHHYAKQKVDR